MSKARVCTTNGQRIKEYTKNECSKCTVIEIFAAIHFKYPVKDYSENARQHLQRRNGDRIVSCIELHGRWSVMQSWWLMQELGIEGRRIQ